MKKTIFICIFILVGVYGLLSILDRGGRYESERALWMINDEFAIASKDPQSVPDYTYDTIVEKYRKFIQKYPKSSLTPGAHILIGRVYMTKGDYQRARSSYEETIKLYKDKPNVAVEAVVDIGRTYALEDNTAEILKNYDRVLKEYPLTNPGIHVPVLKAQFYANRNDVVRAQGAFDDAVRHYKKIIQENPDTRIEFDASRLLSICYLAQNRKRAAVEMFGEILNKYIDSGYLNSKRVGQMIKSINTVSVIELKDYDLPLKIYTDFIESHPGHPLNQGLTEISNSMIMLREGKVKVDLSNKE